VLKIIVFALFMWASCALFLELGVFMKICCVIFIIALLVSIYYEVIIFIHEGFYVTNKHLITYNGRKINLNDIWFFKGGSAVYREICFYKNKNKFIQECSYSNKDDDLDGFLTALYEVSGNRYILQFGSEKISANALESDGRTLIKLIQE
jgi:hypothetical protein